MLSRRSLLAAGALAAAAPRSRLQAAPAAAALTAEPAELTLVPPHPAADAVRLTGPDWPLRLGPREPASVALHNALAETLSLRWDGLRGQGALGASGTADIATFAPGESRTVAVRPLDGGTTLLRAAPSAAHLAERGLQALAVVSEAMPPTVDHDLAVLLADRLFASDGSPRFGSTPPADAVVTAITVNGCPAPWEVEVVPRARVRLRLAGGSVQRLMLVAVEGAGPQVVAVDGQPCAMFAPARGTVPLGPGARYDLMLDMPATSGAEVRLLLRSPARAGAAAEPDRLLVRLRAAGAPRPALPPISALLPNPALPAAIPLEAARRAELAVAGTPGTPTAAPQDWGFNGPAGERAAAPVLRVRQGEAVVLGFTNTTPVLVPLRIAGHAVRLLHARDDGWDPYWRDTLLLPPGGRSHVAFVADAPGLWAIDSGYDDLTRAGLSGTFEVMPG